ncbi:ORF146 [Ranid herpesvirus 2]|uniref:ORF146 n=1 Tax=Ranid herpesvirus 2 TaxID=389214 RepID=Q14VW0_9VIRU|nr:ORF146 [Ranid herpesvirus 2]ABG25582.1 ORF146 [Ranid herpesvirus 2]
MEFKVALRTITLNEMACQEAALTNYYSKAFGDEEPFHPPEDLPGKLSEYSCYIMPTARYQGPGVPLYAGELHPLATPTSPPPAAPPKPLYDFSEVTGEDILTKTLTLKSQAQEVVLGGSKDESALREGVEYGCALVEYMQKEITDSYREQLLVNPDDALGVIYNHLLSRSRELDEPARNLYNMPAWGGPTNTDSLYLAEVELAKYHQNHAHHETCTLCPLMPKTIPLYSNQKTPLTHQTQATPLPALPNGLLFPQHFPVIVAPPHQRINELLYLPTRNSVLMGVQDEEWVEGLTYSLLKTSSLAENEKIALIAKDHLHPAYINNEKRLDELLDTLHTLLTSDSISQSRQQPIPTNSELLVLSHLCLALEMRLNYAFSKQVPMHQPSVPKLVHSLEQVMSYLPLTFNCEEYVDQNAEILLVLSLKEFFKLNFTSLEMYQWGLKMFSLYRSILLLCMTRKHACLHKSKTLRLLHRHCVETVASYYEVPIKPEWDAAVQGDYSPLDLYRKLHHRFDKATSQRSVVDEIEKSLRIREMTSDQVTLMFTKLFQLGAHSILPLRVLYNFKHDVVVKKDHINLGTHVKTKYAAIIKAMEAVANAVTPLLIELEHTPILNVTPDMYKEINTAIDAMMYNYKLGLTTQEEDTQSNSSSGTSMPVVKRKDLCPPKSAKPTLVIYMVGDKLVAKENVYDVCNQGKLKKILLHPDSQNVYTAEEVEVPVPPPCHTCSVAPPSAPLAVSAPQPMIVDAPVSVARTTYSPPVVAPDTLQLATVTSQMYKLCFTSSDVIMPKPKPNREAAKLIMPLQYIEVVNDVVLPTQTDKTDLMRYRIRTELLKLIAQPLYPMSMEEFVCFCNLKIQEIVHGKPDVREFWLKNQARYLKMYEDTCKAMCVTLSATHFIDMMSYIYAFPMPLLDRCVVAYLTDVCKKEGQGIVQVPTYTPSPTASFFTSPMAPPKPRFSESISITSSASECSHTSQKLPSIASLSRQAGNAPVNATSPRKTKVTPTVRRKVKPSADPKKKAVKRKRSNNSTSTESSKKKSKSSRHSSVSEIAKKYRAKKQQCK